MVLEIMTKGPSLDWTEDDRLYDRFKAWRQRVELLTHGMKLKEEEAEFMCHCIKVWSGETGQCVLAAHVWVLSHQDWEVILAPGTENLSCLTLSNVEVDGNNNDNREVAYLFLEVSPIPRWFMGCKRNNSLLPSLLLLVVTWNLKVEGVFLQTFLLVCNHTA